MDVTPSAPRLGVVRPVLPTTAGPPALAPVASAWVVPTWVVSTRVVSTWTGQASIGPVPVVPVSTRLTQVVLASRGSASAAPGPRDRARS